MKHDWDLAPQHSDDLWCLCSVLQDCGMTREMRDHRLGQHGQAQIRWQPEIDNAAVPVAHCISGLVSNCCIQQWPTAYSNVIFILINLKTFHEECKVSPEIKGYWDEGQTVPRGHRGVKDLSGHFFPVWQSLVWKFILACRGKAANPSYSTCAVRWPSR